MDKTLKADQTEPLRALIADRNADSQEFLSLRLAAHGFTVACVASPTQSMVYLMDTDVDVLFLDVSPSATNNLEVLDWLRCNAKDTAVIVTTSCGSEQLAIDVLRHGADDYIRKPYDLVDVSSAIERILVRLRLRRQTIIQAYQNDEKWRQLEVELSNAANVQADLLPVEMPHVAGFEMAAECVPAREVGGDFYDWLQPSPTTISFWLCDVMGKGMAAALLMATVRAVMRAVVRDSPPSAALRYVTAALDADFARTDRFVTLFLAHLDTQSHRLRYVDAGHGHAFLLRADSTVERLTPRGLPLGVMPDVVYREGSLVFEDGDALVIYSDGLIDARPDLALDVQSIGQYLSGAGSALAMIDRLVALLGPVGIPPDDMTLVVLRCKDQCVETHNIPITGHRSNAL